MRSIRSCLAVITAAACLVLTGGHAFAASDSDSATQREATMPERSAVESDGEVDFDKYVDNDDEVTFEEYRALFEELKSSDVPRTEEVVDGRTHVTFTIEDFELTLVDVRSEDEFQPQLGGGWDGGGPYVTFNQVDQGALIAGGGAGLAAAICAIPAVGQVACVAAVAIVGAATYYAINYGRCPNNGLLKVYVHSRVAYCV